jgi:hypothetical protein
VNNAFIRNRIEARDILDFAADSLSQHGVTGRPIHRYASGVAIRRLVNKQTHLNTQDSELLDAMAGPKVANFTVPIAHCCLGVAIGTVSTPPHTLIMNSALRRKFGREILGALTFLRSAVRSHAFSITTGKLNLSFNGFGGIIRWQAAPDEEWGIYGTATTFGESSLSGFTETGAGPIGCSIIYEVK